MCINLFLAKHEIYASHPKCRKKKKSLSVSLQCVLEERDSESECVWREREREREVAFVSVCQIKPGKEGE
jgi:hypothetical protein